MEEKLDIRSRRRLAILTAAAEEFCQNGFDHARMDAIAMRVGIGKSTIYEYFPSKTALFTAVGEQMAEQAKREMCIILEEDVPFRHKMLNYMRFLTTLMAQMGQKFLNVFRENTSLSLIDEIGQRYHTELYNMVLDAVKRARDAGELRAGLDPVVATALLTSVPGTLLKKYDVSAEALVDLLMQGMDVCGGK
ncbi:MAG: TetR/AcrR family transcriptional regulator [Butyricicoccus pullicaecorum]|nr:TetR/AcrR family transcriptional regulator [Butyricicoccus pullicaecorum]